MTLAPLLDAPLLVQVHAVAAIAAFLLGLWQFAAPKGTLPHRTIGWLWVGLMALVAGSSFGITGQRAPGDVSPIHAISVFVLVLLPIGVIRARRGLVRAHAITMVSLFCGALVIAGAFTLLPTRIMGRVVFGG
jgi:uncharacterized membrane protein